MKYNTSAINKSILIGLIVFICVAAIYDFNDYKHGYQYKINKNISFVAREKLGEKFMQQIAEDGQSKEQNNSTPYDGTHYDGTLQHLYRIVDTKKSTNLTDVKYILFWDTFYGRKDMTLGFGTNLFKNCPVKTCFTTNNRSLLREEDFDAIIFHGARWNEKESGIPDQSKRKHKQKYIFFCNESPFNTYFYNQKDYQKKNFYNWTMTYRKDSDIHYPYGVFYLKEKNDYRIPSVQQIQTKKKMAMWLVSNCVSKGTERRIKYVDELKKYIEVDIYGGCGKLKCGNKEACRKLLEENYYYYLAFENSQGQDYVTEKTYENLKYNVIPVVMGNANYDNIVPHHSVIDVRDFSSPKALADYLIRLKDNYTDYTSYFEWKKKYYVEIYDVKSEYAACQLCEMLHRPIEYSSYEDIQAWYYGFTSYLKR